MDLSDIRAQARQLQRTTRGVVGLFFMPILATILSSMIGYFQPNISEELLTLDRTQLIFYGINRTIFPTVLGFVISIFVLSAFWTMLEVIRKQAEKVHLKDSIRAFDKNIIGRVFATLLLKRILLFLWNGLVLLGSGIMFVTSLHIMTLARNTVTISQHTYLQSLLGELSLYLLLGLLLLLIGLLIALPQAYAYTQVEFILYERLKSNTYHSAFQIIRESRTMMKGYKSKRFILDMSFIGWHLLVFLTLGLAAIYVFPYVYTASTLFYEEIVKQTSQD